MEEKLLHFSEVTNRPWSLDEARKTDEGRKAIVGCGYREDGWEERSKNKLAPFIGWDGEGISTGQWGVHHYVMLCNSLGDYLLDPGGLTTNKMLDFLWRSAQEIDGIHVCFGASYDVNMILHTLPGYIVERLVVEGLCHWGEWRIEYRPRRELLLSRYKPGQRHVKEHRLGRSFQLWDVFGFFQCSFVQALQEWDIGIDYAENIIAMKGKRSTFGSDDLNDMLTYCMQECVALIRMMAVLRDRCIAVGLVPSRWDGAGALGSTMLKKYRIKDYMHKGTKPDGLQHAMQSAYYGGRIEQVQWGHHPGPVWSHDIRSAYPWAASLLPCLAHGEWVPDTAPNLADHLAVYHVTYEHVIDRPFHPLPMRTEDRSIHFVERGSGWYWAPEVHSALRHGSAMLIDKGWRWVPTCDHRPFRFLWTLYAVRSRMKADGDFAEKALKLAMNAGTYGKLAQRVGYGKRLPSYHQLEWAGWITSYTRARVYDMAMYEPTAVIAFETDGVYATGPLLESSDGLGGWEVKRHEGIVYVQSGFYFLGTSRPKHRGFDAGTLTRDDILRAWSHGMTSVSGMSTRFRGMHVSVMSDASFSTWCQWVTDDDRTLQLYPSGKRTIGLLDYEGRPVGEMIRTAAIRLLPSQPRPTWGVCDESVPHSLPWITGVRERSEKELLEWVEIMESEEDYT